MNALQRYLPILRWLPNYRRADLAGDVSAGLTVAVMLVPQGMAYAMLANLPPVVGLYASVIPLVLYALFGTSRQLAVGPVAMVSLLVATGVGALAAPGTPEYLALALTLSLLVGALQLVMGLVRLGFLVNFLSHPVISGFTSAAALIIGLSQLKHLLGIPLKSDQGFFPLVAEAFSLAPKTQWTAFGLGAAAILTLVLIKRFAPRVPGALVVVVLGTLAVAFLHLPVKTVGLVPAGLPSPSLPGATWATLVALLPTALTISLVGFMESISVAQFFAAKNKYELAPNQELVGLGLANLGGAFFGAYPVTGGFSRTAVNAQAGARTSLATLLTALLVGATLLFFTPLFKDLPNAVLAAIILVAVSGLVDLKTARHLWHLRKGDFGLWALTFVATLALGVEEGILTGVGASLALFVVRTTRPHYAVLGRLPGTDIFRNVLNFPEAKPVPGLLALRFDAAFYFGNVSFLKERLSVEEAKGPISAVLFDMSGVNDLDASAAEALLAIVEAYQARQIRVLFAEVKGPVRAMFERSGLTARLQESGIHLSTAQAVEAFLARPTLKAAA